MDQTADLSLPPERTFPARFWIMLAVCAALVLIAFRVPIDWMIDRWTAPESYYSHGFLVPFIALFFVWRDRKTLLALPRRTSWVGLACMLVGVVLFLISGLLSIFFTGMFGMILFIWGLCGFIFGLPTMRRLAFPMFVLLFMVPLPLDTVADLSLKLKLFVAHLTLWLINAIGISSVNDGATIYLGDAVVTVGNACSGLRSLISLLFLGVLFAAIGPFGWRRRTVLFIASMPIAIISNVVRVFVLCMAAYWWGGPSIMEEHGFGPIRTSLHDASGYLIFIVAFGMLYGTMRLLEKLGNRTAADARDEASAPPAPPAPPRRSGRALWIRVASVLAVLALINVAAASVLYPSKTNNERLRTNDIPVRIGAWSGQDLRIDDTVRMILETDDVLQRDFYNPLYGEKPVQLAVVYSGSNRRVAHPPEVCYTAGGWEMMSKKVVHIEGAGDFIELELNHAKFHDLVYYTFKAGDTFTPNYYRQQIDVVARLLTRRNASTALVRFSTLVTESESEDQARRRIADLAREVMPVLDRVLN